MLFSLLVTSFIVNELFLNTIKAQEVTNLGDYNAQVRENERILSLDDYAAQGLNEDILSLDDYTANGLEDELFSLDDYSAEDQEKEDEEVLTLGGYAVEGQFPFIAALLLKKHFKCVGSIISSTYILTAAHCIYQRNPLEMTAILGALEMTADTGIVHNLTRFIVHDNFDPENQDFDIGLVQVAEYMILNTPNVNSIQLSDFEEDYPVNTLATIIGYAINLGANYEIGKLKYAYIPMWNREECNNLIYPPILDHMICAGHILGNVSSCAGDSGGPLIIDNKLMGVVAFGFGCGTRHPAVYIKVPSFYSWIVNNTEIAEQILQND